MYGHNLISVRIITVWLIVTETTVSSLSQQTPMHTAAKDGNEFTMKGLFKLGADVNIEDKNGVRL